MKSVWKREWTENSVWISTSNINKETLQSIKMKQETSHWMSIKPAWSFVYFHFLFTLTVQSIWTNVWIILIVRMNECYSFLWQPEKNWTKKQITCVHTSIWSKPQQKLYIIYTYIYRTNWTLKSFLVLRQVKERDFFLFYSSSWNFGFFCWRICFFFRPR